MAATMSTAAEWPVLLAGCPCPGSRPTIVRQMGSFLAWVFLPAAVVLLLVAAHHADALRTRYQRLLAICAGLGSLGLAVPTLRTVASNLARPREWDFVIFWLWGRLGTAHVDFYDPREGLALGQRMGVSEELAHDILSVGFWYPPETMLLFAPLGWFDMRTAMLLWYVVQGASALGAVLLLSRMFLGERGALGLGIAGGLLAICPPAKSTVWFAQSNFLLLFLFLLLFRDRDRVRAGLWIALGAIVKPYFVLLFAYLVIKRAYRALGMGASVLLGALGLSTICFGIAPLVTFLRASPTSRVPGYIYGEPMNQSLLGALLRASTGALEGSLLGHRAYVGLSMLLVLISAWAVYRATDQQAQSRYGLMLTLMIALLLYPGTLAHYSVLLLAPLLALWSERRTLPCGAGGVMILAAVVYAMLGWDRFETYNFWANLTVWAATSAACVYAMHGVRAPEVARLAGK